RRLGIELGSPRVVAVVVLRHEDRSCGGMWVVEGIGREPGAEGRPVFRAEPLLVAERELRVVRQLRLEPEVERRGVVELVLAAARRVLRRGDPDPGGGAVEPGRAAVP